MGSRFTLKLPYSKCRFAFENFVNDSSLKFSMQRLNVFFERKFIKYYLRPMSVVYSEIL